MRFAHPFETDIISDFSLFIGFETGVDMMVIPILFVGLGILDSKLEVSEVAGLAVELRFSNFSFPPSFVVTL